MAQNVTANPKEKTLLSLTNDVVLQLFFTKEENRILLREFLKATTHLTDDDLIKVEIKNTKLLKEKVEEKDFIVDIHVTSITGHRVIIEMQVQNHANFTERIVSYNARNYASQLKRGESYTQLKESITLVIVDFRYFDDTEDFFEHILFRRNNRKIFTKAQQFYIIDLTKLPSMMTEEKHHWGALFRAQTEEELKMIMETSEVMKTAGEKLLDLSEDENARELAELRELALRDWHMRYSQPFEDGMKQGIEQGIDQGKREKAIEIAKCLLAMGVTIDIVEKGSGLAREKLEQLKIEMDN